jgi:hypothetical protein
LHQDLDNVFDGFVAEQLAHPISDQTPVKIGASLFHLLAVFSTEIVLCQPKKIVEDGILGTWAMRLGNWELKIR